MQWDENELDTQVTQNKYIGTPNSEILAKALTRCKKKGTILKLLQLQH